MAEASGDGINRRRILQGAAWTAPAVLVATATPSVASSSFVLEFTNVQVNDNTGNRAQIQFLLQNFTTPDTPITDIYVEVTYSGSGTLEGPGDPWEVTGDGSPWIFSDGDLPSNGDTAFALFYIEPFVDGDTLTLTAYGTANGGTLSTSSVTLP
ncbi:hypothetical protein [Demequina iriomotensis]|uniref:hypothetical protein n=1 Tax=Demequina iriomotensis TaxID=1536641 RepID=UPI000780DB23|nr:hypothetical protein [Demequina iriomotensis]